MNEKTGNFYKSGVSFVTEQYTCLDRSGKRELCNGFLVEAVMNKNDAEFVTDYALILEKVEQVDPVGYAKTRNFLNGSVTRLSPYISRGVISLQQVKKAMLDKGIKSSDMQRFLQELGWREYFQRVWEAKGDLIFQDLRQPQSDVDHYEMPDTLENASTGINAIDLAIKDLYQSGYMHNHMRMYVSSLACNVGRAHWLQPSRWLYYHLYDGDLASNTLNWQWIAGSFSSKKYYCNQENINRFTGTNQRHTFLDKDYSALPGMEVPASLKEFSRKQLQSVLPSIGRPTIDVTKPTLLYNSYNLDPLWRREEAVNRILLLEPSHFDRFPVSEKVIDFIVALAANIPGIQILCGELADLYALYESTENEVKDFIISKDHPAFQHYPGTKDSREWMYPQVSGYFPSFSGFWKRCEKFSWRS